MKRFLLTLGVLLGFAFIFVGDAHKILPVAVLWSLNAPPDWTPAFVIVAALLLLCVSDLLADRRAKIATGIIGLLTGVLAWLMLTGVTETPGITLLSAIPFIILTIGKLLKLLSPPSRSNPAASSAAGFPVAESATTR